MDFADLSLRQRAGQLVWPRLGSNMQPPVKAADDEDRVAEIIEQHAVGGLIIFNAEWSTCQSLLARLQHKSEIPLLISSDIERGAGQQVSGLTLFPHAQAIGRSKSSIENVSTFARITAIESRAAGLHLAFAPVADVDLYNENPIIATRAFHDDPTTTARHVETYIQLAEENGMLTTAKHFPGHGRTTTDSHDGVPVVDVSRKELDDSDLIPFRYAVNAGVSCIMTSHVAFPQLDNSNQPATRSAKVLRQLLREELGFEGVVVSDSLLMEGARDGQATLAEQAASVVQAGVDVLLDVDQPGSVIDALCNAVNEGLLAEGLIDDAASRIWHLKEKVGLLNQSSSGRSLTSQQIADHDKVADQIAREALSPNPAMEATLRSDIKFDHAFYLPTVSAAFQEEPPAFDYIREKGGPEQLHIISNQDGKSANPRPKNEWALIILAGGPAAWRASHLSESQQEFVGELVKRGQVVVAALGPEALLKDIPDTVPAICTYSDIPHAHKALSDYLSGQ